MEWFIPILICMLVGIVLMVVEVFMPGFGIPGISATVLLLAGIVMTWYEYGAKCGLAVTVALLALIGVVISISLKSVRSGKLAKTELRLDGTVNDGGKSEREQMEKLVGKEGVTLTPLRPVGAVEFDFGKMNVQSDDEFIEKGEKVRVIKADGRTIYVKKI